MSNAPLVPDSAPFTPQQRAWLNGFFEGLYAQGAFGGSAEAPAAPAASAVPEAYTRQHPFLARLLVNRKLNAEGSAKDTRHLEISLGTSGMTYEVGDSLGVVPTNCTDVVDEVLKQLGFDPSTVVDAGGQSKSVREAFLQDVEITRVPKPFLQAVSERSGDAALKKLIASGTPEEMSKYLWGREIIDLLKEFPKVKFQPAEFIALLKKLQPRLYSISSSLKAHPGQVHLTVAAVRYESFGRARKGVCSTFLADRVSAETPLPVFVHTNKSFRPPVDPSRPMIMVGPGTGIAPFRAFLEERKATGAKGKNWLFFGDQHVATDFLYKDELEKMRADGLLTRLDTAFSRDQKDKIYVQDRINEQGPELFRWLEEKAHLYVCGDAKRMAGDVDRALHQVIQKVGGKSVEEADEYVKKMQSEKRYQRDVY